MFCKVILSGIALSVAALPGPSFAADKYIIDPQHVWVNFSIQQYVFSKALGRFKDVKGEIVFDENNVAASSVRAEIVTESVDTGDEGRDDEVKFGFLRSDRGPSITFVSTGVEKVGEKTGRVTSELTI